VSVAGSLKVSGIEADAHVSDVLGLAHIKFQGLIAAELRSIGYRIIDPEQRATGADAAHPPLTLVGVLKEEICDEQKPQQCRVLILWELQDARGVASYRVQTRAVAQAQSVAQTQRELVKLALRSLLTRRRFTLQLREPESEPKHDAAADFGPLGFKQCRRSSLNLRQAVHSAAASLVFVEAGSDLAGGAIVSGDGLILTRGVSLAPSEPLNVRFASGQVLPATVVATDKSKSVALLHVDARTDSVCLRLSDDTPAHGAAVFGVASEPTEDRAISLNDAMIERVSADAGVTKFDVDPRIARLPGGPLLDEQASLVGVVVEASSQNRGVAHAIAAPVALDLLHIKPAAITDPRLLDQDRETPTSLGYVRDRDDPAFLLSKRYTYGTGDSARTLRRAGLISGGVGLFGIGYSYLHFLANPHESPSAHTRTVVINDISWVLFGLGAVGFGASYAWPESHDVVGVQSARRELSVGLGPTGFGVAGTL
jgi:S1-C subfamily serine protease